MSYTRDEVLLRIQNVSKRYGSKEVLTNVNLEVRDLHCSDAGRTVGQVVAIVGPSGVGKSQILQIIAGLERPTAGTVTVNESQIEVHSGMVGLVGQKYLVWDHHRVLKNLLICGGLSGMDPAMATQQARQYLAAFKLPEEESKFPQELSGGMRQRVAIIRQLLNMDGPHAHPSRLLLLDEPFASLDVKSTRIACDTVRTVADLNDKNTIILVSHDIRAVLSTADMVVMLKKCPGAGGTVAWVMDLSELGLAWKHEAAFQEPEFIRLEKEIYAQFV